MRQRNPYYSGSCGQEPGNRHVRLPPSRTGGDLIRKQMRDYAMEDPVNIIRQNIPMVCMTILYALGNGPQVRGEYGESQYEIRHNLQDQTP